MCQIKFRSGHVMLCASLRKSILFRIPHLVAAFGRAVNTSKLSEPNSSLKQTFNNHTRYQKAHAPDGIASTGPPCVKTSAASSSPPSGSPSPHIALANPIFMLTLIGTLSAAFSRPQWRMKPLSSSLDLWHTGNKLLRSLGSFHGDIYSFNLV